MTVSSVTPRVKYNGSGSTGPFSIPFYWLNSSELVVTKTSTTGVESTLAVTTHFTLTGAGSDTGSLTLVTTLAVGETLTIERATTQTQAVDLARTTVDYDILEGALDKLTRHAQDLWVQVGRSLRLYKDDTAGSGSYNAGGQKISNLADGTEATDACTYGQMDAVAGSASAATASAAAAAASAADAAASAVLAAGVAAGSNLPQTFALSGDITPSQITSNQNNYNPTGLSTATVLRLSTDASRTLTGLAGGSDGRWIIIHNVGSNQLVLSDDDAASTAANRFSLRANTAISPDQAVLIQYDSTASRWRLLGGTGDRVYVASSAPATATDGDLWFDSVNNILYVYKNPSWVNVSTLTAPADDSITNLKLANMAALTVKGNATNATADPSDIAASVDGHVLRRSGTALGFGTVATAGITDDAVTNAKAANMAANTIKGRITALTGDPEDLTPSQAATIIGMNTVEPENRIINGAFDFWQRGTSSSSLGYVAADRWNNSFSGGTCTMSRQSFSNGDVLGKNNPTYYMRLAVSGHSLSSHLYRTYQTIESVRTYAGQTITILGWARRSSGTGNMAISYEQSFGTGGSPSAGVSGAVSTVTLTGSWAPFAATVNVPSISGKTLGSNNNDLLLFAFWVSAGSDHNSLTGSLGLQTINVDLWGVHIRVGTHTTAACDAYIAPELQPELARCQRYYQKIGGYSNEWPLVEGYQAASNYGSVAIMFPVQMRTAPTLAKVGTWTVSNCAQPGFGNSTPYGFNLRTLVTALGFFNTYPGSTSNFVTADAEL